jgi:predicted DNA-binding protein (MmcQ/YjbR family)
MSRTSDKAAETLRAFGLTYPEAHIKSPWPDHKDVAVNDKTFAYISTPGHPFSISCKLPTSHDAALGLEYCEPTAYGLGQWGWVTAKVEKGTIPIELFKEWIDESYRAQAPKRLVRLLKK